MAAAGAVENILAHKPLQFVDYDVPEVSPPPAEITNGVQTLKAQGPWYRIRPETAVIGEEYVLFNKFVHHNGKHVTKKSDGPVYGPYSDGTIIYMPIFDSHVFGFDKFVDSKYDSAGKLIGGFFSIYALKKPVPAEVAVGLKGQQYRQALVRAFGPQTAIDMSMDNVNNNAKKRRSHILSAFSRGGKRRRRRRQTRR